MNDQRLGPREIRVLTVVGSLTVAALLFGGGVSFGEATGPNRATVYASGARWQADCWNGVVRTEELDAGAGRGLASFLDRCLATRHSRLPASVAMGTAGGLIAGIALAYRRRHAPTEVTAG